MWTTDKIFYIQVIIKVGRLKIMILLEMLKIENDLQIDNKHNFHVMRNRFATIWGGTSLLELFLKVIAETKHANTSSNSIWAEWDYILNLSESDMPLLSLEELEHNLARFFI